MQAQNPSDHTDLSDTLSNQKVKANLAIDHEKQKSQRLRINKSRQTKSQITKKSVSSNRAKANRIKKLRQMTQSMGYTSFIKDTKKEVHKL